MNTVAVYRIHIEAPGISEEVVTAGDTEEQAKERAVASALARQLEAAIVRCVEIPDDPRGAHER
jgi:hypothetical protein